MDFSTFGTIFSGYFQCLGLFNLKPGHQPVKLLPGDRSDHTFIPWPAVTPLHNIKPFIEQDESIWFFEQDFDAVTPLAAEKIYGASVRFGLQLLHEHCAQTIY